MDTAPGDPIHGPKGSFGDACDTMLSYEVRAMGDRVALIYDTPKVAYIHEMELDQAAIMLEQLVSAIREARAMEQSWA